MYLYVKYKGFSHKTRSLNPSFRETRYFVIKSVLFVVKMVELSVNS